MNEINDLISINSVVAITTFILGALSTALIKFIVARHERKSSWKDEKKVQTTSEFYENVAKINFLIGEYFKDYCDSAQSFSGMNLSKTEEEVFKLFSELYGGRYKAKLYMNRIDYLRFDNFISSVENEYDGGKETYGMWDPHDELTADIAETQHSEEILSAIEDHTIECLQHEFSIKKTRRSNRNLANIKSK